MLPPGGHSIRTARPWSLQDPTRRTEVDSVVETPLAGRPAERTPSEYVEVDVEDGLSGLTIGVEHRAKSPLGVAAVFCERRCTANHFAGQPVVLRCQVVDGWNVRFRNHQH